MRKLYSVVREWRASSAAVLPLTLLHALGTGFQGLSVLYFLRGIRCEEYKATLPPHVPEGDMDVCRSPAVQKAYSVDFAVFTTIITVISIVLSGPYGKISDLRGRKRALSIVAVLNWLGNMWIILCCGYRLPPRVLRLPYLLISTVI
jgi:MFS family permease